MNIKQYLEVAKQALAQGKIAGIMDGPITHPEQYQGEDPYFSIRHEDDRIDMVTHEGTSDCIVLSRDIDSPIGEDVEDDTLLEEFARYILG